MRWLKGDSGEASGTESAGQGRGRKRSKAASRGLALILVAYVLVADLFPAVLFKERLEAGLFVFHYRSPSPGLEALAARLSHELESMPGYDPSLRFRVYLCDSPALYAFLNPASSRSKGTAVSLGTWNRMTLAGVDVEGNAVVSAESADNRRRLDSTLLHEACHVYLSGGFGPLSRLWTRAWAEEGLCERYAGSGTLSVGEGLDRFLAGSSDSSPAYRYFRYRLYVAYLVDVKGLEPEKVLRMRLDEEALGAEVRAYLEAKGRDSILGAE